MLRRRAATGDAEKRSELLTDANLALIEARVLIGVERRMGAKHAIGE
jgi:hypothetical protein